MKPSIMRFLAVAATACGALAIACGSGGPPAGPVTPAGAGDSAAAPTRPVESPAGNIGTSSLKGSEPSGPESGRTESVSPPEALPRREVSFTVRVPENTPPGEQVYLLLQPLIDWWWAEDTHIPMTANGDGTWSVDAKVPLGGLVHYVYDRWDEQEWGNAFKDKREGAGRAAAIESRMLLVHPGLELVDDAVEMWQDLPAKAPAGRLTGIVVDAVTGEPVFDAEVSVGGIHSASVYGGEFEFPQVAAGIQRVTVWHTTGAFKPASVKVQVEPDSNATLRIEVQPATPVQVTFDVSLPEDTPADARVKFVGNVWQLGARAGSHPNYPYMPDGALAPVLERVSPGRAVATLDLNEGTYLSYYYTIASDYDGRERLADGGWVFREHVVGATNETQRDGVVTWKSDGQSLATLRVQAPPNTTKRVPLAAGGHWMTQVGDYEWVTYAEGTPGSKRTLDVSLGRASLGAPVGEGLGFEFGTGDSQQTLTVDRWEALPKARLAADGPVTANFKVSVPSSTPAGADITLVVDGMRVPMTPQSINPWMYHATVELPSPGDYPYHVERSGGVRGPDRILAARLVEEDVKDWVTAWPDEAFEPLDPDFIAGFYTPDYWSSDMLSSVPSTFARIADHNGSLVAVSSVWSYGRTQPLPNVEPRPVESACVCLPYLDAIAEAELARDAGLKVFMAPQFNMEMTQGGMDGLCCDPLSDQWWDEWRGSAEKLWMWNAKVAEEIDADLLLLPGYVFHVFGMPGVFESDDAYREFDQSMIELLGRVREVYHGKVLISGGQLEMELPGHADLIGVTTFDTGRPDLPATATVEEWRDGYEKHLEEVVDPIWERWGKPVFFYTVNPSARTIGPGVSSEDAQAAELEGLFQALESRPWVAGSMTWSYQYIDTPLGDGDGLRGRLAEAVLAKYYGAYTGKDK